MFVLPNLVFDFLPVPVSLNRKTLAQNEYHIYRQIPLHTHDYLKNQIRNVSVATDEGPSPKLVLSEGGSRGNIESWPRM